MQSPFMRLPQLISISISARIPPRSQSRVVFIRADFRRVATPKSCHLLNEVWGKLGIQSRPQALGPWIGLCVEREARLTGGNLAHGCQIVGDLPLRLFWSGGRCEIAIRFDSSGVQFNLKGLTLSLVWRADANSPLIRYRFARRPWRICYCSLDY